MKYYLIFLLIPCTFWSQELTLTEKQHLDADVFVGVDNYYNLYYIKDQTLYKDDNNTLYNFNELQLGEISSVDIINPLNILVFYSDLNTVVLLDNRLNEIERINFSTVSNFTNVGRASIAGKNQLWLFNIDTQQVELYNYRSNRKTVVSQPVDGDITYMISNFNYCYLLTKENLKIYDIYGSLLSNYPMDGFEKITIYNKNIITVNENELYFIPESFKLGKKIFSPDFNIKDLQLTQEFLYIYDGKQLHVFSIKLPKE
jgi:hypothetical protein